MSWTDVCDADVLVPDRGVAALINDEPVAIFLLSDDSLFAVDHREPASGAPVMARGLVGSAEATRYLASPLLKERYSLETGKRVDGSDNPGLQTHAVRIKNGTVQIQLRTEQTQVE